MLYDKLTRVAPVAGGWTADKKFRAAGPDGTEYFLRIAAPDRAERLERAFRMQLQAWDLGIPMARPVECGPCPEGFYALETWLGGVDAREILPDLSDPERYAQGLAAGRILKKLHSIPAPADRPGWADLYNAKIGRRLSEYLACPLKYGHDEPFLAALAENRQLLEGRPQCFLHGDFHVGNFMFVGPQLNVIDFDRCGYGDPWSEFKKITWCAAAAPALACGIVDGYFDGEIPEEFWRLLALYLCCGTLGNLPWAIPYGEAEVAVMRKQAEQVLDWYDGMRTAVPSWYTEKWKKGEGYMTDARVRAILAEVSGWLTETPIETDRILLRPFRALDRADFLEYVSQPELQRLAGMSYDSEAEKEQDFLGLLPSEDHPPTCFAVEWKPTGKVIGNLSIGIYPFVITDPVLSQLRGVSLSCVLHEGYQRRGIMTEVFPAFLDLCLGRHGLDFVNAGYFEFNEGSRRLQEKCGFRHWTDGRFSFRGEEITTKEMLLLREDWNRRIPHEL